MADTLDLGSFSKFAEEFPDDEYWYIAVVSETKGAVFRKDCPFSYKKHAESLANEYNRAEVENAEMELRKPNRLFIVVKATVSYTVEG